MLHALGGRKGVGGGGVAKKPIIYNRLCERRKKLQSWDGTGRNSNWGGGEAEKKKCVLSPLPPTDLHEKGMERDNSLLLAAADEGGD